MTWLLDRRAFNVLILVLYLLNACRWALAGSWVDVCYWICAAGITATVTWGYAH